MKQLIFNILAFFYKPFSKMMPFQTFRYIACGGGNTLLDFTLFSVTNYIIFKEQLVHLPFITMTSHIAAVLVAFAVSFPTGFLLNKYIVFSDSNLRGRVQLVRYVILVACCLLLNYVCMKLFVDICGLDAMIGKVLTIIIVVSFSYITQKKFTFKVKVEP
jgi:putative flippase GtrA